MFGDIARICQHHFPSLLHVLLEEWLNHQREPAGALPHPGAMQEWVQTLSPVPSDPGQGGHTIVREGTQWRESLLQPGRGRRVDEDSP